MRNRNSVINFGIFAVGDINEHLLTMYDTVIGKHRVSGVALIVELGVRTGISTFALSRVAEDIGAQLISVDINDCSKACDWNKWAFKRMDSLIFADTLKKIINNTIDILFIDTIHTYDQTTKELLKYLPLMSPHGIIMLHDTRSTVGVGQAIDFVFGIKGSWSIDFVMKGKKATIKNYSHNNGMAYIFLDA